jgi:hypothetical protein
MDKLSNIGSGTGMDLEEDPHIQEVGSIHSNSPRAYEFDEAYNSNTDFKQKRNNYSPSVILDATAIDLDLK